MAKKQTKPSKKKAAPAAPNAQQQHLPKEVQDKLKEIQGKLNKFQKEVLAKFDRYIIGISLLPPEKKEGKVDKDKINLLVLVDDSDSTKMSKTELRDKLFTIIDKIAQDVDKNIVPQTILLSEVWHSCYDGKYDLPALISMGAPVYDTGMLGALKITEIHKNMTLKKFEKYIVSYVFFGSMTRGEARPESDVDVAIIVDDTDVKKMTRAELKDKLRAIILGMGIDAGEITGIKNKLNIQVYILTDFWESIKDANPVFFTILRDGVPLYDRGMFMPWKQLLKMGKIKPSTEAIDMFMSSGEQMMTRVKTRMRGIVEQEIYWSLLTPTQAAIMLYGVPPPTPKETVKLLEEIFVKKEKMLEPKYVDIMEEIRKYYKGFEEGKIKEVSGKEIDSLLDKADKYMKRIKRLFTQIERMKEEESVVNIYETVVTVVRDVLRLEGVERAKDTEIVRLFETELVHLGKVPEKYIRILNDVVKTKEDFEAKKLAKTDIENVKKKSKDLIKYLVEYVQRKRGVELERARIRVKYGDKYGDVLLLGDKAFITHDLDAKDKKISAAMIRKDGSLDTIKDSSLEELEGDLSKMDIPPKVFIKEKIFEDLKRVFGKNVEILVNY